MRLYLVWGLYRGRLEHVETLAGERDDVEGWVMEGQRLPVRGRKVDRRSFVKDGRREYEVVAVEEADFVSPPISVAGG